MEPITELRPVDGPVVYGYLRLPRASPARREALVTALTGYCQQHELALAGLFTERGDSGAVLPRSRGCSMSSDYRTSTACLHRPPLTSGRAAPRQSAATGSRQPVPVCFWSDKTEATDYRFPPRRSETCHDEQAAQVLRRRATCGRSGP